MSDDTFALFNMHIEDGIKRKIHITSHIRHPASEKGSITSGNERAYGLKSGHLGAVLASL